MRKLVIIAFLILSGYFLVALSGPKTVSMPATVPAAAYTDTLNWNLLAQTKYVKKQNANYPEGVMYPIIAPALKTKQQKPIVMSGFIIPIDNKSYALSKNVLASCFFRGQAGPESIMGITFKNPSQKFKTDTYVTLQGNFRYNDNDAEDWIYHLENAVVVSK